MPKQENKTVLVTTDAEGCFKISHSEDFPNIIVAPVPYSVNIKATIASPEGLTVNGTFDLDAADGSTQNEAIQVMMTSGQEVDLGDWRVNGKIQVFKVSGNTTPLLPETEIIINILVTKS